MRSCCIKGIPYDFNGNLSLENKVIMLSNAVCQMAEALDDNLQSWFSQWAIDNLDKIFGNIMYEAQTETLIFDINTDALGVEHG